jgi:CubicO group peptidase (beta-lactamase class C family)
MKNLPRLNNMPWLSCLLLLLVHGVSVGFRGGVPSPGLQAELASNPDLSAIRAYIEQEVQRQRLPGLAVAITHGEQTIFLEGFGHSRKGEPITPYTPFFIGSLTKSFTALAILQLIEAGLVDLDAPVQHYLPWFRVADEQAGSQITVCHLLNQTSGMSYRGYRSTEMPVEASMEENGRALASARLTASPGTRFQYFNANYVLLGLVIEAVSGQPYEEYLAEHIFEPLGMEATYTDLQRAQAAGLAQGYNPFLGIPVARQQRFLGYDLPAGFILSNAADLAHYLIAHLNAGRFGEAQILSSAGIAVLHQPVTAIDSTYAMGWQVGEYGDVQIIEHDGAVDTFSALMRLLPDEGYGLVLLTNQNSQLQLIYVNRAIADGVTDLLLGQEPRRGLSVGIVNTFLLAFFALTLIPAGLRLARLRSWIPPIQERRLGKLPVSVIWQFLLPVLMLVGIPALLITTQGLTGTRILLLHYLPEATIWLALVIALNLVEGSIKAVRSLKATDTMEVPVEHRES